MAWVWLGALLCYATQALAGILVWRAIAGSDESAGTRLGAALIVGPCAVTLQMLGYHAVGVPYHVLWLALPWWVLFLFRPWAREPHGLARPSLRPALLTMLAGGLLFACLAASGLASPIHVGDEVNNFSLFAKVFGSLGSLAPDRLTTLVEPGHVEYPHLVALNQAWLFALDADTAPYTARGFDLLGALAFVLLCVGLSPRGKASTAAVCMVCIATPEVLRAAIGFADVRLLATFMLLGQQVSRLWSGRDPRAPWGVAVALGTAALTKNEGLALAAVAMLVLLLAIVQQRSFRRDWPALALALSLLALWPLVRLLLGLSLPYVDRALSLPLAELSAQTARVLCEWARLMFPLDWQGLQQWGLFWWVAVPLVGLRLRHDRAARWLALAWLLHLGLYTYVLAAARPGDLDALLGMTASRLLLHTMAWPVLIVLRPALGSGSDR